MTKDEDKLATRPLKPAPKPKKRAPDRVIKEGQFINNALVTEAGLSRDHRRYQATGVESKLIPGEEGLELHVWLPITE